jgi:hypothetical protein
VLSSIAAVHIGLEPVDLLARYLDLGATCWTDFASKRHQICGFDSQYTLEGPERLLELVRRQLGDTLRELGFASRIIFNVHTYLLSGRRASCLLPGQHLRSLGHPD